MAAVDRGLGGRRDPPANSVAVSGRPVRRAAGGRFDRPGQTRGIAAEPAATVGRVLASADAVAGAGARCVLEQAAGSEPQEPALAKAGGTRWDQVLFVLVAYRLLAPGSEWRLHREWFLRSALADLLGEDAGLAEIHKLYRCHDQLLSNKQAVFDHLTARWRDLFNISYDVLLYDLTSTPAFAGAGFISRPIRRFPKATRGALDPRATTGRIVCRSSLPWW